MSDPYVGEIRLFAFPRIPSGWLACNGQTLQISDHQQLYALLGIAFGGNGQSTFAVPKLNGRVPIDSGTGTGLTPRTIGQTTGTEMVQVTQAQMPAHNHVFQATTVPDSNGTIGSTVMFAGDTTSTEKHYIYPPPTNPTWNDLNVAAISTAGGNQPHKNNMPTICINFCICEVGLFPQRA